MNKTHKQTALITGAASGIGYELVCIFAENGYNLVLVDRTKEKLEEIATKFQDKFGIYVKPIVRDLSKTTSPEEIFQELEQANIKVDVLVNNAGFGTYGLFNDTNLADELEMLQVNLVCTTHLTKLFLKNMVQQGEGKILNVSSAAAFQPGPLMAVYFATKAYVLSFSEALANELDGTGVTVTVLCPGTTQSAFHQRTGMADSKLVKGKRMMDAATVADIGYRGLMQGKTIVIPGLINKIMAKSIRFIPRKLVTKIVRNMQENK
ncbi:Short-chain dehydrogenase/reductase SDR [Trichormus variabilis ATCC 29413]|uniref:Short-chain dehydrogenase/reductase SDR n=2 Tax=Anabaena variabilis TaxID=264691 RepID=Q3MCU1_TRIV2|nr:MULTISPECIES: SDR family oxidoreductase [Nostocaceae]ABA21195.1 Short-chain dehydrogenase/reductase SDR [Trichormus variabilis ATCC 29413]MBC1214126.1 SDR family oxidoreductase [Trichormus variabilis ARAD]MBC1256638.1 SDR family oxidoreductase [Trichormus variabilis V5]MBC1267817.1 SDR family oxidoreductase [Trichormus variabilis FSR]MBC1303881.1 SDR family oxidoreductase [Trichormus variabilis N2B]